MKQSPQRRERVLVVWYANCGSVCACERACVRTTASCVCGYDVHVCVCVCACTCLLVPVLVRTRVHACVRASTRVRTCMRVSACCVQVQFGMLMSSPSPAGLLVEACSRSSPITCGEQQFAYWERFVSPAASPGKHSQNYLYT